MIFNAGAPVIIGGGGSGLKYATGEFKLDADTNVLGDITIQHDLGEVPKFICVWSDDFVGLPAYTDKITEVGFIWLDGFTGMTPGGSTTNPILINMDIGKNATKMNLRAVPRDGQGMVTKPTATEFTLINIDGGTRWRGGKTYKFMVAESFWDAVSTTLLTPGNGVSLPAAAQMAVTEEVI